MEENKNQFCSIMPVDAAGNIVPIDTEYMYDSSGVEYRVLAFEFLPATKKWMVTCKYKVDDCPIESNIDDLYLIKDDIYKKLKDEIYHLVMSEYLDDPEGDVDRIVGRIKDLVEAR